MEVVVIGRGISNECKLLLILTESIYLPIDHCAVPTNCGRVQTLLYAVLSLLLKDLNLSLSF